MPKSRVSAGLLMYRMRNGHLQVLLAHPGGPFFAHKDLGSWSIPKGEIEPDEDPLDAARREFQEEIGLSPQGPFIPLSPVQQKGGKIVHAWAFEGDFDSRTLLSNTFLLEWPPGSGQQQAFPEVDRAEFFDVAVAKQKIKASQAAMIEELVMLLKPTVSR